MALRFFMIPMQGCLPLEREFNALLRSHTVLSVDRRFVEQGPASVWALCVDYLEPDATDPAGARQATIRGKVDYRDVLTPEQFSTFSRLRDARKQIALAEGVPLYTIFNNLQLATMVQQKATLTADLERIVGVGDARVAKYGDRILAVQVLRQRVSRDSVQTARAAVQRR